MRKYLFIMANEGHPWGGSEHLWSAAAERLARRGNEVRVSAKDWGERVPEVEELRSVGCQIFYRKSPPPFLVRASRKVLRMAEYRFDHVADAGRGVDLAVISQGSNDDGLLLIEAARAKGLKYAILSHSAVVYWWPSDELADRLAKVYDAAGAAYFVSQSNIELSRRQFGSKLSHAKVVRNPFNVNYNARVPWPTKPAGELSLAFVGRLDIISKGHDLLLQALARPRWRERDLHVSFVGEGPHERALRRMADELKLTNVSFAGQVKNIEKIWSEHHALVLASRFEGMPLVVVEAMLCARPCVVTNVGGNADLVRDAVNGFVARAATVDFVDEAMNRAWENRHRLQEMGDVAVKDVRNWVSKDPGEDFANELERLLQ
ncbi:MAG TPA: glycosyltransferase family 4 protein [Candidatus Acidoferrum sp.]|jgi:glycosyltransferase involved in cell wall biosynthesis